MPSTTQRLNDSTTQQQTVINKSTLFLTLKVFSATGGIEKVCRVAGKALFESTLDYSSSLKIYCMHDHNEDADNNRYFPSELFRGFGGRREQFILSALSAGANADTVILSHINLLVVGWLIKKRYPKVNLVLFAHGIEIWEPFGKMRNRMLQSCDRFVSVSKFTSDKIQQVHGIDQSKCRVLNNCLDPFLPAPCGNRYRTDLRGKYGIRPDEPVLFTLSRLYSRERYKGYDKVLEAMGRVKATYPNIRYLLAGSHDAEEKKWLDDMIAQLKLEDNVIITGYLQDADLAPHFEMADVYIMPSRKEGFGIVFIEAMYYGLPVIAGNADGSVDALLGGDLGVLVNPDNVDEIQEAIENILGAEKAYIPNRGLLNKIFSYEAYKQKLADVLDDKSTEKSISATHHLPFLGLEGRTQRLNT